MQDYGMREQTCERLAREAREGVTENPKLGSVRVVFFDVDGVFTDGKTWQDRDGRWRRTFSVRDTMGVRALRKAGLRVCVLTPALSTEIRAHFQNIGVDVFRDNCLDAEAAVNHVLKTFGLNSDQAAFVRENANGEVELGFHGSSLYQAARTGGDGAVLEISSLILQHASQDARVHATVGEL